MAKQKKAGMYGDMPKVKIGKLTICMMSDDPNEQNVWIQTDTAEGAEFKGSLLEIPIQEFFDKNF